MVFQGLINAICKIQVLVLEVRNQKQSDILEHVYSSCPRFGSSDGWTIQFTREINNTSHVDLLNQSGQGAVLHEGKMIHQFKDDYAPNKYWIDDDKARNLLRKKGNTQKLDVDFFRIANRRQARSTDERTMIATIIPSGHFAWDNMAVNRVESIRTRGSYFRDICFIVGVMNSMIFDFILGLQINSNLSFFIIYSLPVPFYRPGDTIYDDTVSRVTRLVSVRSDFSSLWSSIFSKEWQFPDFWYPASPSIDTYGPAHEQEICRRLRDEAPNLTPEWGPHCGVHDRLPDRRDTGDRAQLRAEIDAYVAHLYGLSRDDFAYILETFPVLKKKEKKVFGEFMSKRKCLEEYDRIKIMMNAEG